MPLIKTEEIRKMSDEELKETLRKLRDDLLHERGQAAMGGAPESPGRIRALRKNVARILTVMNEKQKDKGGN